MKIRAFALMAAVVAVSAVFAACGGDDDDSGDGVSNIEPGEIRVDKGLAVAALGQSLGINFNGEAAADNSAADLGSEGTGSSAPGAAPAADIATRNSAGMAEYWPGAPALQTGGTGLTVQGYGSATATADQAVVEVYFYRDGYSIKPEPLPVPEPGTPEGDSGAGSDGSVNSDDIAPETPGTVEPITEAELQPVIDAMLAAGASEVELVEQPYFDPFYSNATLRAKVTNLDAVQAVLDAASSASGNLGDITFSGSNAYYTVSDCSALERAAMEAAVEDAAERGDVLADVLSVGRGEIIGASSYSYAPYDDGSCTSSGYYGPYPVDGVLESAPGPSEVQVFASITVTYAIQ
ncbi:MAG: SIMPL domain-containing protein [Dehalococcoidia bacterium]